MNELDGEALALVRVRLIQRLRRHEVWDRNAPLREAIAATEGDGQSLVADILTANKLNAKSSLESFELSIAEFPSRLAEQNATNARYLASVRRRTVALRSLLESLQ